MNADSDEIDPDAVSPWWPCPECGGTHFRTVCCFERGGWIQYMPDEHVWEAFDPPNGKPTGIVVSDVECVQCGHVFDIARHYEWPMAEESADDD